MNKSLNRIASAIAVVSTAALIAAVLWGVGYVLYDREAPFFAWIGLAAGTGLFVAALLGALTESRAHR